jgi:hypothetical protein
MGFLKNLIGLDKVDERIADSLLFWTRSVGRLCKSKKEFIEYFEGKGYTVEYDDQLSKILNKASVNFKVEDKMVLQAWYDEFERVRISLVTADGKATPWTLIYENEKVTLELNPLHKPQFIHKDVVELLKQKVDEVYTRPLY